MLARVGRKLVTLALVHGFGYVAAFGWNVIAARVTSVHDYGVLTLAFSLILALQVLFEFGQQRSLVRFLSPLFTAADFRTGTQLSRRAVVLPLQMSLLVGIGLAVWVGTAPTALWGGLPAWQWMLLIPAGLGAALMNIQTGAYIAAGRAIASSVLSLVVVPVALCAAFAWQGRRGQVEAGPLFTLTALAYIAGGVFSAARLICGESRRPSGTPANIGDRTVMPARRIYYGFAAKALLVAVLSLGLAYADRYLLGAFASLTAVGLYNLPARTSRLLNLPVYFLNPLAGPVYTRANQQDTLANALGVYRASARLIASVVLPIGLTGAVCAGPLLRMLGGEQFTPAASSMTILVAGAIILTLSGNSGLLLQMGGRENDEVRATACGLFVNIALAMILLRPLGIVGVAIGTSLGYSVVAAGRLLACWRRWRIAIWDLLGLRQVLAVVSHLGVLYLGRSLGLSWMVAAGIATVVCVIICAPWSAIRELARAIAVDDAFHRFPA